MIVANEINYSSLIQIHNKKIVKPTVKLNCWIIEQLKLNFIGVTTAVSLLDDVNWHGCQKRKYFDVGNGFFRWKSFGHATTKTSGLHEMQSAVATRIEFESHKIGINKRSFINFTFHASFRLT